MRENAANTSISANDFSALALLADDCAQLVQARRDLAFGAVGGGLVVVDADQLVARLHGLALVPGDVVLLHEGERPAREALPRIAALLTARGLRSTTLGALLDAGQPARSA